MVQLAALMWMMAFFFGFIGLLRGWNKEIISTAGIVLGLFALFQFDTLLRGVLLANVPRDQVFFVQAIFFVVIVYFAYQQRALMAGERRRDAGRDDLQNKILGAILGFVNGYLIWGSLWYFLDINEYPLDPLIIAPSPGSFSDQARTLLPLVLLGGGPAGNGDLLAVAVIVLFVFVLIVI
ncbi:MAG: CvpA family protein [Chloroflexota bacterium]|nr:CvpA family protein [Chloroflexota bacterium]